jgi:hypothetical protein
MKKILAVVALLLSACSPKMTTKDIIGYVTERGESRCKSRNSSLKGVGLYVLIFVEQNKPSMVGYTVVCIDDQVYSFEE